MPPSSAFVLLPFGSLTGVIPVDSISRGRVLGDFSNALAGPSHGNSEFLAAVPFRGSTACAASPPSPGPRGDGGI